MQPTHPGIGAKGAARSAQTEDLRPLVYIVDDEVVVGDLVGMSLARQGYRTRVFHDPVLAYSTLAFGAEQPVLLIADYAMRGMNGLELMQKCRRLRPGLKTMSMSGSLTEEELLRAAEEKPDAFLGKPFTIESLTAAVKALVGAGGAA